jgi:hypothetical protein
MPSKKIKISELPLVESLKGLYTIGYKIIDGIKTSVKVSLEDIQTAYQDVVNAIKKSEEAAKNANNAATTANEKAVLADTAAANANDTAEHSTYIGTDHYVYKWNKTAQAYDKTDIYTKGDAFSIKKVYVSVAEMEADKSNPDIAEGDFVLVNTGDVEDPDNAKLYVKADGDFEFLVDMSGAIGFTGKTPQFSMGTVTTLEAGASAIVTVSDDGTDDGGNPKYKINFAIPRGNPGAPFRVSGEYATLEALKSAVPDGSAVDGFMAVGTEAPYDYYAWVNGDWVNQGKIAGGGSGNVVVIPAAAMSLSDQATSDEIFNAFGGKDAFMDICQSIVNKDTVCVVANIPEESGMKLVYIPVMAMATYTDANNANFMMAIITETTFQLVVTVTDGIATQSSQVLNHIYEAPSDGNVYGRKNKDWVKVPEKSDVLTKDNTTAYTPTQNYHPATKKYADASSLYKVYNLGLNVADKTGVLLLWEAEKDEYNATVYRGIMMGSFCTIPLNGITQAGTIPLVSMSASFRKVGDNNETVFMYARDSSSIRVAPATVIYNNKDYTALQVEVNGEADIMNFVGYFDRPPLLTWVPYREETGSGEVILNEEINNSIDVFATKEFVYSSNVLTKNNTSPFTPTGDYQPATKKYVDEQMFLLTISDTGHQELVSNQDTTGETAATKINTVFGSADNFKSVVSQLMANKRLVIKITETERFHPGVIHSYMNTDNGAYELSFDYNYSSLSSTGATLLSKRIFIAMNNNYGNFFIVRDIVTSDNLTTLTKKSTEEYTAITNKDANTAYCVTD